ncbi:MAG: 1-acyl-sn-glycerol-3-phosphate acyltransferase [Blastocatellia bacterium]
MNLQTEQPLTWRQRLARGVARATGWRIEAPASLPARCVIIGAPHTSSMDLWLTILFMEVTGFRFQWVAKDSLFREPLGTFLRALGGVPVNRRARTNFVDGVIDNFRREPAFRFAIIPEGTRQKAPGWKTGFYYIAMGAEVPIVFGFLDYGRKAVGVGGIFTPTGDMEADFEVFRAFYQGIQGRYPDCQGEIRVRPAMDG